MKDWIRTADLKPKPNKPVLVFNGEHRTVGYIESTNGEWVLDGLNMPGTVTHWMPLPKLPNDKI